MPELVSVVIPTRNRPAYLKQALDSVYAQTYQQFEIIIINDGGEVCPPDFLAQYDARLRYVTQEHKGASAARNNGITQAKGQYIAFLDDDDILLPRKLQKSVEYFATHPEAVWLCSGFSFIDENGKTLPRLPIIPQKTEITPHDIAMFTFIHTSSVMVRKTNIEAVGGFPEGVKVSEDYHTWARVLMTGGGGALPDCLTQFRQHRGNTKLPLLALLKENTRIIDMVLAYKEAGSHSRKEYINNLYRIILDDQKQNNRHLLYIIFLVYINIVRLIKSYKILHKLIIY